MTGTAARPVRRAAARGHDATARRRSPAVEPQTRLAGDGGAAMVEFALVLPVLALFMMGLFEFGYAYKRRTVLEGVVASADRVAVQLGRDRTADAEVLRSLAAGLSAERGLTIERAVVWKANGTTTGPRCVTGGSVTGLCNVYTSAQVTSTSGVFTGTTSCSAGAWDLAWCPINRVDTDRDQDYVGVFVQVRYQALTKVSTANITLTAWNVMRIEPPLGMDS